MLGRGRRAVNFSGFARLDRRGLGRSQVDRRMLCNRGRLRGSGGRVRRGRGRLNSACPCSSNWLAAPIRSAQRSVGSIQPEQTYDSRRNQKGQHGNQRKEGSCVALKDPYAQSHGRDYGEAARGCAYCGRAALDFLHRVFKIAFERRLVTREGVPTPSAELLIDGVFYPAFRTEHLPPPLAAL